MERIKDFLSSLALQWTLAYLVFGIAGAVAGYGLYELEGALAAAAFFTLCVFAVQQFRELVKVAALLGLTVVIVAAVGWLVYLYLDALLSFPD